MEARVSIRKPYEALGFVFSFSTTLMSSPISIRFTQTHIIFLLGLDKPIKKNSQLEFKHFRLYFEIYQLNRSRCIKPGIEVH